MCAASCISLMIPRSSRRLMTSKSTIPNAQSRANTSAPFARSASTTAERAVRGSTSTTATRKTALLLRRVTGAGAAASPSRREPLDLSIDLHRAGFAACNEARASAVCQIQEAPLDEDEQPALELHEIQQVDE